jgi:hypothetical protein
VAERGGVTGCEYGRHPLRFDPQNRMPDGVNRRLDAMQPLAFDPMLDCSLSEPERAQLRDRHDPVLSLRKRRDGNRIGHVPEFRRRRVTRARRV